jgi:hypothetical protein
MIALLPQQQVQISSTFGFVGGSTSFAKEMETTIYGMGNMPRILI